MLSVSMLLSVLLVGQTSAPDLSPTPDGIPAATVLSPMSPTLGLPADVAVPDPAPKAEPVAPPTASKAEPPKPDKPDKKGWILGYKNGLTIKPEDPEAFPFDFRLSGWIQMRGVGFIPTQRTWTDRAGVVRAIRSQNYVEVERARLVGSGTVGLKDLTYFVNVDGDTDTDGGGVKILDAFLTYRFDDTFRLSAGKNRVPFGREWQAGARDVQDLIDRSMATTLFRPDRSVGIWATGTVGDYYYHAMVSDGFNTSTLAPSGLDTRFTFSESVWWEPLGEYGLRTSDFDFHDSPVFRLGHSLLYSPVRSFDNTLRPEAAGLRLTDGTVLTDPNVFGRRTQVLGYDQYVGAVDGAVKYRGMHFAAEGFVRNIDNLKGIGRLPSSTRTETGYYVNVGKFLVEKRWQVSARVSQAFGYRTSTQLEGAVNWHPTGTENLRITASLDWLENNAANNSGANYRAGDSGFQLMLQVHAGF